MELGQAPSSAEGIGADLIALLLGGQRGARDGGGRLDRSAHPSIVEIEGDAGRSRPIVHQNAKDGEELVYRGIPGVGVRLRVRPDVDIAVLLAEEGPGHAGP